MTPGAPSRPAIAVLGAGAWGTALAVVISRNGFPVHLWGQDPDHLREMQDARENQRRLPGVALPPALCVHADLGELAECDHFLVAVSNA